VPILFGDKTALILPILPLYVATICIFSLTMPIISYFQAKDEHIYAGASFIVALLQVVLISFYHSSLEQFVRVLFTVSIINLEVVLMLYVIRSKFSIVFTNLRDLLGLFVSLNVKSIPNPTRRILILNWRDTKHSWAGGAEAYIHELAKRWVKLGYQVTVFCGNDGKNPRNEVVNGVQIVRRGGLYTVYIWAFLYYILRFRGNFDAVLDSENGIPFFTPLYVKVPKFLLIHHIHQEVFLKHLPFPLSYIGLFLETKMMPLVYKNTKIVTVSESSKKQILNINLGTNEEIEVIHPGVNLEEFSIKRKTKNPTFVYLGRLKPYKNIDIALKAFKKVLVKYPNAVFNIAGTGESSDALKKLAEKLEISEYVNFLGSISNKAKQKLLAQSWVMVQPSMVEGWGITVIEANASGTPVIASDVYGLRDSVVNGKTGVLVNPKNIDDFASAMINLTAKFEYRQMLSKEASIWSKNFSWDKSAAQMQSLIEKTVWEDTTKLYPAPSLAYEKG
jgi:glycosyltransferase involved in cell wall biosynthesis